MSRRPLDPQGVKLLVTGNTVFWGQGVMECATEAEAPARTNGRQPSWLQGDVEFPRYRSHKDVEPIFSATLPLGSSTSSSLVCMSGKTFLGRRMRFLDFNCRCESTPFLRLCGTRRTCPIAHRGPKAKGSSQVYVEHERRCTSLDAAQRWRDNSTQALESMIFSRRGFSTPFLPWKFADLHLGAW